jgi:hypothetical protein
MGKYAVVPLGELIDDGFDVELLENRLKGFRCVRDEQLESFAHNLALFYEAKGYGRTYLVFDTNNETQNEIPAIVAFFTLALTATDYSDISKSKKEKVLGSKPGRNAFKAFAGILVGQLARDDRYSSDFINGSELLEECERYINYGRHYLGGRIVYLDCRRELVKTYQKSDYKQLTDVSSGEGYFKMYKVLPDRKMGQ